MIERNLAKAYMTGGYELWYFTPKGKEKYIHFSERAEMEKWCKRNYKNITLKAGSWLVLHIIACFKTNETKCYNLEAV